MEKNILCSGSGGHLQYERSLICALQEKDTIVYKN